MYAIVCSLCSSLDDIVLSYVESIVEEVMDDPDSLDSDAFLEMLSAYVPSAEGADKEALADWVTNEAKAETGRREAKKGEE